LNNRDNFDPVNFFPGLEAGDYIIYIRTADDCAHFQQKVTLESLDVNNDITVVETESDCDKDNGVIELQVPVSWQGFTYALNDSTSFQTETVFDSLAPNIYVVYVR